MDRRTLLSVLAGSALLAGLGAWTVIGRRAGASPGRAIAASLALDSLVDQDGRRFSFADLRGRTVAMNFIFTHCASICPTQTRELARVQRALGPGVRERVAFVSVSIDPVRDTPSALRAFADAQGADLGNWAFVTGSSEQIARLSSHFGTQVSPEVAGQFNHRIALLLFDAQARLVQTYTGLPLDEPRIVVEIETVDRLFNPS